MQPVLDFFAREQLSPPQLQPMVRGRLVAINDQPVNGDSYPEPRARGLVEREFNLSYMEQMPEWNELVSGKWWASSRQGESPQWERPPGRDKSNRGREGAPTRGELSVEEGVGPTLGIYLRDTAP